MGERIRYELAISTAEVMYALLETEYQREERDLDATMRRLKDLSAYSLTHAEIMGQREGAELLAMAMFFGTTSDPRYHKNQERLGQLSRETLDYQGQPKVIEQEVAKRQMKRPHREKNGDTNPSLPRLF